MYQLQFFSRPSDEGEAPECAHFGFDGTMSVYELDIENHDKALVDLEAHAQSMDCIYGEVLVMVSYPAPWDASRTLRTAFRFQHKCEG